MAFEDIAPAGIAMPARRSRILPAEWSRGSARASKEFLANHPIVGVCGRSSGCGAEPFR